jgi:hypothetical protein
LREATLIGTYRLYREEGFRALIESRLVNETYIIGVAKPLWTAATP